MHIRSFVAFIVFMWLPISVWALSAAEVNAVANTEGANVALSKFFSCEDESAYEKVASGASEWLAIAVRLLDAADACVAESLHDAIARAIVPAPTRVLALVDTTERLRAKYICVPFLSEDEPDATHLAFLIRAEKAVLSANSPSVAAARAVCLRHIRGTMSRLKNGSNSSIESGSPTALAHLKR